MKSFRKLLVFGMVVLGLLMLIGCEDKNYYTQQEKSVGKIEVIDANTQKVTLPQNPDGSFKALDYGNIIIYPRDVKSVLFQSYRMGKVRGELAKDASAIINNMSNKDAGTYYLELKDSGDLVVIMTDEFEVTTYKPMYFHKGQSYFEYSEYGSTVYADEMTMTLDTQSMSASIIGNFGCDKIFGTTEQVDYQEGLQVVFEESTGAIHSGEIKKGLDGNLAYAIKGIPVVAGYYGDYYGKYPTSGKMYILFPDGKKVDFRMGYNTDAYNEDIYTWSIATDMPRSAGSFYADSYSDSNGIVINYYPPQP